MAMAVSKIVVTRAQIAAAGGVKAALEEALSLAALQMTPRAMTVYEAVGSAPTEEDGAGVMVQIEVQNEEELREAIGSGAEAVLLVGVDGAEARRLEEIAGGLRGDLRIEKAGREER